MGSEKIVSDLFNPYALTKHIRKCVYFIIKKYVSCNIMRYFNVYGKLQPSKGIYALVIGIFLNNKNNKPLTIYGDGKQKRDFIHVNDVVRANYKCMISNINGEIFNVGYGKIIQ